MKLDINKLKGPITEFVKALEAMGIDECRVRVEKGMHSVYPRGEFVKVLEAMGIDECSVTAVGEDMNSATVYPRNDFVDDDDPYVEFDFDGDGNFYNIKVHEGKEVEEEDQSNQ
jgi:hypothetical protein